MDAVKQFALVYWLEGFGVLMVLLWLMRPVRLFGVRKETNVDKMLHEANEAIRPAAVPNLKEETTDTYTTAVFHSGDLTIETVVDDVFLSDDLVVLEKGKKQWIHRLGGHDFIVAAGNPTKCAWKDAELVRIIAGGKVVFWRELVDINDFEGEAHITGYQEDGSDVAVFFGRDLTVIVDAST